MILFEFLGQIWPLVSHHQVPEYRQSYSSCTLSLFFSCFFNGVTSWINHPLLPCKLIWQDEIPQYHAIRLQHQYHLHPLSSKGQLTTLGYFYCHRRTALVSLQRQSHTSCLFLTRTHQQSSHHDPANQLTPLSPLCTWIPVFSLRINVAKGTWLMSFR